MNAASHPSSRSHYDPHAGFKLCRHERFTQDGDREQEEDYKA
jgi:hypothetical protein